MTDDDTLIGFALTATLGIAAALFGCYKGGVSFLVQNEAGELVRTDITERRKDAGEYVRVVEEEVVRDMKELRGELKRMVDWEVRQEVRGELKWEIEEELARNVRDVGLVAEAIRDIEEDVRREVDRERKKREGKIKMDARIVELEKKAEEKKSEEYTEEYTEGGSEYGSGHGSEDVMQSKWATSSVSATTSLR